MTIIAAACNGCVCVYVCQQIRPLLMISSLCNRDRSVIAASLDCLFTQHQSTVTMLSSSMFCYSWRVWRGCCCCVRWFSSWTSVWRFWERRGPRASSLTLSGLHCLRPPSLSLLWVCYSLVLVCMRYYMQCNIATLVCLQCCVVYK